MTAAVAAKVEVRSKSFSYIYEAGVDVVTSCLSIPGGQLDTVIIIWFKTENK